ncbi:MAG: SPOR domain-containing protein [Flavobacteriales bacterium]|nr:SPOR domain-containing protein [Flavobacteriales bacterium]
MRSLLVAFSLFLVIPVPAQTGTSVPLSSSGAELAVDTPVGDKALSRTGDVKITVPPRIEALLKDHSERKHPQKGYRVQIFLGDRKTAEDTKRAFLQKNPDIPAYLSWLAPNFRLRVGDLYTRLEAEHLLRDMKLLYPGSYIVPDEIEMPRLED